jgi:hypothetical protein
VEAALMGLPPLVGACAAGAWAVVRALEASHRDLAAARDLRTRATAELEHAVRRRERCMAALAHLKHLQEACRTPLGPHGDGNPGPWFVVVLSAVGRKLSQSLVEAADLPTLMLDLEASRTNAQRDAPGRHSSFSSKSSSFSSLNSSWGKTRALPLHSPTNSAPAVTSAWLVDATATPPARAQLRAPRQGSSPPAASAMDALLLASRAKAAKRRTHVATAVRLGVDADEAASLEKLHMCRLLYDWQEVSDGGGGGGPGVPSLSLAARDQTPEAVPEEVQRDAIQVAQLVATLRAKQTSALPALHALARRRALRCTYDAVVKHPASGGLSGGRSNAVNWAYGEAAANAAATRKAVEPAPYVFVQNR